MLQKGSFRLLLRRPSRSLFAYMRSLDGSGQTDDCDDGDARAWRREALLGAGSSPESLGTYLGISRVAVTTSGGRIPTGRARSLLGRASPGAPITSVHDARPICRPRRRAGRARSLERSRRRYRPRTLRTIRTGPSQGHGVSGSHDGVADAGPAAKPSEAVATAKTRGDASASWALLATCVMTSDLSQSDGAENLPGAKPMLPAAVEGSSR